MKKISGESGKSAEPVKIDLDETLIMIEKCPKLERGERESRWKAGRGGAGRHHIAGESSAQLLERCTRFIHNTTVIVNVIDYVILKAILITTSINIRHGFPVKAAKFESFFASLCVMRPHGCQNQTATPLSR